jgi:FtsP/CotA-like multicopper oxidase with cupredoxin domain
MPTLGDFVYHCHILKHEDRGMMAIIRVQKAKSKIR